MVADRRFGPLALLLVLGLSALCFRMFQIQVRDRAVWAQEAANLLRSSTIVPYHRGRILDAKGRVLVRDEDVYQVELVYRTFRRGHPLGQVAHAWSSLTLQPVSLVDALADLERLGAELVELSPGAIERFARGGALPELGIAAVVDPSDELRSRRASDVRFYIGALLELDRSDWSAIRSWKGEALWDRPWIELACRAERPRDLSRALEERRSQLRERLRAVRPELERLAQDFDWPELIGDGARRVAGGGGPADALVLRLEASRREVENATADELFAQATGFGPGRVSEDALPRIELDWIALLLRWDAARLDEWVATRRESWTAMRTELVRRLLHEVSLSSPERRAERLLDGIARLFERPDPMRTSRSRRRLWREIDELVVLAELDGLFAGADVPAPELRLPFQFDELREAASGGDGWGLAGRVLAVGDEDPLEVADRWRQLTASGDWLDGPGAEAVNALVEIWESWLLEASDACLPDERLTLAQGRLERGRERERYVIKDRSSRPMRLQTDPPYEVVHLLTRHHERYRGFAVRDVTRRVFLEHNEDGTPVFGPLIGRVRQPKLSEVLAQSAAERELARLKRKTVRSAEDELRMVELSADLLRYDEMRGTGGIESYFDPELRGRNGFLETDGLQERMEGRDAELYEPPIDGLDVALTLDLDLQRAAQRTLANPVFDRDEQRVDRLWLKNPVGAIVLMAPDGALLTAASEPTLDHPAPTARLWERANPVDRTLQRPTFNPPGSVFKPFVAAWALEHHGLEPQAVFGCDPLPDGSGPGYKVIHCTHWHDTVDLEEAIYGSCNSYFARVGEEYYDAASFLRMAHAFGFDRPTGIRSFGREGREGLVHSYEFGAGVDKALAAASNRMRAANGLGVIDATPVQVARATAALLTGRLPSVRLVGAIDGQPVEPTFEELDVSWENLERVHRAMEAVVTVQGGTAFRKGLDADSLGFQIAIKTGSADYLKFRRPEDDPLYPSKTNRMRKHTWIAGWFPADDPKAVLVVYLHDVSETSSHTAVWVARQFLQTPEVAAFLSQGFLAPVPRSEIDLGGSAGAAEASAGTSFEEGTRR